MGTCSAKCEMKSGKIIIAATFLVGMAYRLLMGMQGIDSIDMGFCMTFYQNIFSHPEAMTFYFNYYLTGLVGGVWHLVFGQFGLMGFRVLETLAMSSALMLLYLAFRPWLTTTRVAVAAILLSFLFPSFVITFHYDTLSFLLISGSVYAMVCWYRSSNGLWLWGAGVFIGVSFYARIVNGALVALVLLPFIWGYLNSWKKGLKNAMVFALGMLMGSLLVVCLMLLLGHWQYFVAGLTEAFGTFSGQETSHTSGNLFGVYLKSYVNIALQVIAIVVIALFYRYAGRLPQNVKPAIRFLLLAVMFLLVFTSQPYLSAIALCTLLLVVTKDLFIMGSYVLCCAYLFPFGSDIGIPGIFHWCAGLLIIPAACCYSRIVNIWQKHVVSTLCVAITLLMIYKMGVVANGEESPRTETTTIALLGTLNVMTDSERAARYQNEVARIKSYGEGNPLLLIGNQASELYYATGKLPFTGNTQMGTFMGESLHKRLDMQYAFYKRLPLIAYIRRGHGTADMPAFRQALSPWMHIHHYKLVYEDDDIELFKSED